MERERRAHARHPYHTTVTIEHAQRTWSGFVLDYSEGGLLVVSFVPAQAGDRVRLWFQRPSDSQMVEIEGEVSRQARADTGGGDLVGVGIRFVRRLSEALDCA